MRRDSSVPFEMAFYLPHSSYQISPIESICSVKPFYRHIAPLEHFLEMRKWNADLRSLRIAVHFNQIRIQSNWSFGGRARCLSYGRVQVTAYGVCLLLLEFACSFPKSDIELGYCQKVFIKEFAHDFKE